MNDLQNSVKEYSREELSKLSYRYKNDVLVDSTEKGTSLVKLQCPKCKSYIEKGATYCYRCNESLIKGYRNISKWTFSFGIGGALASGIASISLILLVEGFRSGNRNLLIIIPVILAIVVFIVILARTKKFKE